MYTLSDQQIDFILNDIKTRGVEMEDLQLNLLDHICCIIERELPTDGDFEQFYQDTIPRFFRKELREIEEETVLLLTFKNYFAMKNVMIKSGFIAAVLLIIGVFFKLMHWPGASVLFVLGTGVLSVVFLPLVFILKTKDNSDSRDKLVLGLGTLVGIFLCWATLFKVMHWSGGNGLLWFIPIGISAFLLIPVYFFTGIRNPDIRINTIVTTVMLLGGTGLLFSLVNIQPSINNVQMKMNSYVQNEELLKKLKNRFTASDEALTADINNTAEQIKALLLENTIGQTTLSKNFRDQKIRMRDGVLSDSFINKEKGRQLFEHLKEVTLKYNERQTQEKRIPTDLFQTENMGAYNIYAFLNTVVQLQMHVLTNEPALDTAR